MTILLTVAPAGLMAKMAEGDEERLVPVVAVLFDTEANHDVACDGIIAAYGEMYRAREDLGFKEFVMKGFPTGTPNVRWVG